MRFILALISGRIQTKTRQLLPYFVKILCFYSPQIDPEKVLKSKTLLKWQPWFVKWKKIDPGGNIGRFCSLYEKKTGNFGRKEPGISKWKIAGHPGVHCTYVNEGVGNGLIVCLTCRDLTLSSVKRSFMSTVTHFSVWMATQCIQIPILATKRYVAIKMWCTHGNVTLRRVIGAGSPPASKENLLQ